MVFTLSCLSRWIEPQKLSEMVLLQKKDIYQSPARGFRVLVENALI